MPVPTIGWLTWHVGWWWDAAVEHANGRNPRPRAEVTWSGEPQTAIAWLRELRSAWLVVLEAFTDADLDAVTGFPWQDDPARTVADTAAWVNAELMKNAAEIGQLRLLRAARSED